MKSHQTITGQFKILKSDWHPSYYERFDTTDEVAVSNSFFDQCSLNRLLLDILKSHQLLLDFLSRSFKLLLKINFPWRVAIRSLDVISTITILIKHLIQSNPLNITFKGPTKFVTISGVDNKRSCYYEWPILQHSINYGSDSSVRSPSLTWTYFKHCWPCHYASTRCPAASLLDW